MLERYPNTYTLLIIINGDSTPHSLFNKLQVAKFPVVHIQVLFSLLHCTVQNGLWRSL